MNFIYLIGGCCSVILAFLYKNYYKKKQKEEAKDDPWYGSYQDERWSLFYVLFFFGLVLIYHSFNFT